MNTLAGLASLENNWDSYGASKIDPRAIAAAEVVLAKPGYPVPRNDGGIDMVWIIDGQEFNLEIYPEGLPRLHPDPKCLCTSGLPG